MSTICTFKQKRLVIGVMLVITGVFLLMCIAIKNFQEISVRMLGIANWAKSIQYPTTYYLSSLNVTVPAGTGWYYYRFGDVCQNHEYRKNHFPLYEHNYKTSIAYDYMIRTDIDEGCNYTILRNIINERSNEALMPSETTLVMHWRTGDVIDNSKRSVDDFLYNFTPRHSHGDYVKPYKYYVNILHMVRPYHLTDLHIVTGWHRIANHAKSVQYINAMIRLLQNVNFNMSVSLRINGNPDDDLVFMCNSNYFVRGGGGYDHIIANIVQMNGGNVYPNNPINESNASN